MLATAPRPIEPNPHRPLRVAQAMALLAGAAGALIPACAGPETLSPLSAHHAATIDAIAAHAEASNALLQRHVEAALSIQRVSLAGRVHRELLHSGLLSPTFEPSLTGFEALLGDPDATEALVLEVRLGRMSAEQAQAWLADYALACRMSRREARQALLAQLSPMVQLEATAVALRNGLADHAEATLALIAELRADADALNAYARQTDSGPTWDRARTRLLVEQHILARIDDPERRAAAADLLDLLLTPWHEVTEGDAT